MESTTPFTEVSCHHFFLHAAGYRSTEVCYAATIDAFSDHVQVHKGVTVSTKLHTLRDMSADSYVDAVLTTKKIKLALVPSPQVGRTHSIANIM